MKQLAILFLTLISLASFANNIRFHISFLDSIRQGQKTATIRPGHRDYYKAGPGRATARGADSIKINIEEVIFTTYVWDENAINSEVLRRENLSKIDYEGFNILLRGLQRFYPSFVVGDPVTIVYFSAAD